MPGLIQVVIRPRLRKPSLEFNALAWIDHHDVLPPLLTEDPTSNVLALGGFAPTSIQEFMHFIVDIRFSPSLLRTISSHYGGHGHGGLIPNEGADMKTIVRVCRKMIGGNHQAK